MAGKIKKLSENELVGGTQSTDVYPVTSVKAIYDEDNERLDGIINRRGIVNISTNYNSDHIAEVYTLEQAIAKVPSKDRVLGFQGKFLTSEGWKSYIFTGDSLSNWSDISKWIEQISSAVLAQELGDSTSKAISQKAVTDAITDTITNTITNTINLSSLDFDMSMIAKIILGNNSCKFIVMSKGKNVGILHCFSDDSQHMLTQVFTTHCLLPFSHNTHSDDKIYQYFRSYHLSGGTSDLPHNTWGEWKQVYSSDNQKDVDALKTSVNNLNANTGIDEYEEFSDQKEYKARTTVKKDGLLYTFITDHAAGAWNPNEVEDGSIKKDIENKYTEEKVIETSLDGSKKTITFYKNQGQIPSLINSKLIISIIEGFNLLSDFPQIYTIDDSFNSVEVFNIANTNIIFINNNTAVLNISNKNFSGLAVGISSTIQISTGNISIALKSVKIKESHNVANWTFDNLSQLLYNNTINKVVQQGSNTPSFVFKNSLIQNKKYLVRLVTEANILSAIVVNGGNVTSTNLSKSFQVVDTTEITKYFQVYLQLDKAAEITMQYCLYSDWNNFILKLNDSSSKELNQYVENLQSKVEQVEEQTGDNSSSINNIKNEIYRIDEDIISTYTKESFTNRGVLRDNGSFHPQPTDSYYVTDFIEIGEANKINFSGLVSFGGGVAICFYSDSDYDTFISYISQESGSVSVPTGAKYIKAGYTPWAPDIYVKLVKATLSNKSKITPLDNKINGTKVIILDKHGNGDYTEIDDAIDNANDSADSPTTILVMPGTYKTKQRDSSYSPNKNNRYLNIIGVNKYQCIIANSNGAYTEGVDYVDNSCLSFAGNCLIKNITIKSTHEDYDSDTHGEGWCRAYCIHIDSDMVSGSTVEVNDCILINDHHSCVGIGGRNGTNIIFRNCLVKHSSIYASWDFSAPFFVHEVNKLTDFKFIVDGCRIKSTTHSGFNISYNALGGDEYPYICEFIQNVLKLPEGKNAIISSNSVQLGDFCYGNNYADLNNSIG